MKVEILMNGSLKMAIIPENALEEMFLENFAKQENEADFIAEKRQILDKEVPKHLVIKSKGQRNDG